MPTAPVRVELTAPDGDTWTFGPADAADRVTGPALDFCLLVTQRRHRADLALVATGPVADEWLDVAQAFAGPPGAGRGAGRASERGPGMSGVLRIGNASGFYGDRFAAWREMLDGGELDVLTGDYLAELTMLILGRDRLRDPDLGLREDVPAPAGELPRHRARARRADRHQRRRAQPGRAGRRDAARSPTGSASTVRVGYVEGDALPRPGRADRQRLPRRVRHRRLPATPARTSWSPAGSPTPRWWSARRSPTSAGAATTSTRWPGRPWPGT